jgi:hypothetical protein
MQSHCSQQRCDNFIAGLAIQDNNLIPDVEIREGACEISPIIQAVGRIFEVIAVR